MVVFDLSYASAAGFDVPDGPGDRRVEARRRVRGGGQPGDHGHGGAHEAAGAGEAEEPTAAQRAAGNVSHSSSWLGNQGAQPCGQRLPPTATTDEQWWC